jgi:hypothetical protein
LSAAPALVLMGRPGCHLCEEMRELVERVIRGAPFTLAEKNIDEDESLLGRYALAIPVLLLGDVELARHRIGEQELRARLRDVGLG